MYTEQDGLVAYLDDVDTLLVDTVIILLRHKYHVTEKI